MSTTVHPQPLHPGDKIALAATARKVSPDEMEAAIRLLESWGLQVVIREGLYSEEHQMAGSDETRATLLQQLIDDDSISAIMCVRGGYGTVRIIDWLDCTPLLTYPKWIIGYSDVTVLHSHLHQLGLETLHATMPINIPADAAERHYPSTESLRKVLFGEGVEYTIAPHRLNLTGVVEGEVVGGNLSILYSLMGSKSQVDTRGKILFIEDLDEYLYHIDRMMQGLRRCGMLENLQGLIVGAMSDMHDNTIPFGHTAYEIIRDSIGSVSYPILFNAPFGHIGTDNCALPLGRHIRLNVDTEDCHIILPPSCC